MILYSYHSFVEVIYRAATTRMEYYGEERVSKYIVKYLKDLSLIGYMPASKNIIADINDIINKKQEIDTSGYKKFSLRPKIKYKKNSRNSGRKGRDKQSGQNRRNRLIKENEISDFEYTQGYEEW